MKKIAVLIVIIGSCFFAQVVMADMGRVSSTEHQIPKNTSLIEINISPMPYEIGR